jgi:hypothetical protein
MLAIGSKIHGFKHDRDDGFVRAVNIRSATFFGLEVKLLVPFSKILRLYKGPYEYERDISYAKFSRHFHAKFILLRY